MSDWRAIGVHKTSDATTAQVNAKCTVILRWAATTDEVNRLFDAHK